MVEYNINDNKIKIYPSKFKGKKSQEYYEKQIYSTLSKIGLTKEFIEIEFGSEQVTKTEYLKAFAQVRWWINRQEFVFRCESQKNSTLNLGAISQAIQEDIRQVTRGIKDLFTIMNQYKITNRKKLKKINLLEFDDETEDDCKCECDDEEYKHTKKKKKNENSFDINELTLVHIKEGEKLSAEYEYLRKVSNDRIGILYLNLKNQCIKQNKRNHPLLKALTILKRERGLE